VLDDGGPVRADFIVSGPDRPGLGVLNHHTIEVRGVILKYLSRGPNLFYPYAGKLRPDEPSDRCLNRGDDLLTGALNAHKKQRNAGAFAPAERCRFK
jgi:hypothetical protein